MKPTLDQHPLEVSDATRLKAHKIDECDLDQAAGSYGALGSKHRMLVLLELVKSLPKALTISELQERLKIAPSTLHHHLRILRENHLITQTKQQRHIYNQACFEYIKSLGYFLLNECCSENDKSENDKSDDHQSNNSQPNDSGLADNIKG
ncbi:MAG: winged helix-turn-helix domain-containing protein [Pseudomonadota bacterium]